MFAQWELGPAEKYNRVKPAPPSDSMATRQGWFQDCLDAIGKLNLKSVAFPYDIGCGLAGGKWARYDDMLQKFACENPETEVFICRWTGVGGKRTGGRDDVRPSVSHPSTWFQKFRSKVVPGMDENTEVVPPKERTTRIKPKTR